MPERKCQKCGYHWESKSDKKPKECPACKSRYWEKKEIKKGAAAK